MGRLTAGTLGRGLSFLLGGSPRFFVFAALLEDGSFSSCAVRSLLSSLMAMLTTMTATKSGLGFVEGSGSE